MSTGGDGKGAGANQLTADVARMIAQIPELIETLTGIKMADLLAHVAGLEDNALCEWDQREQAADGVTSMQAIEGTAKPVDETAKPDEGVKTKNN